MQAPIYFFFGRAYLPIENTLDGKRPSVSMDPEPAQPVGGARKIMVRYHAWALCRISVRECYVRGPLKRTYRSWHHDDHVTRDPTVSVIRVIMIMATTRRPP